MRSFGNLKDVGLLGIANISGSLIGGLFWIYLASELLSKEEYGGLGYLYAIANVGFAISRLGLNETIVVYGAKKEYIFESSQTLAVISTSIVSILIFFITQNPFVSFLVWGMMSFMVHMSILNSKKLFKIYAKDLLIQRILGVIIPLGLYFLLDVNGIILGIGLASIVGLFNISKFVSKRNFSLISLKSKKKFISQVYFNNLSNYIFWWGSSIVIGTLMGFSFLANYQLAIHFVLLLGAIPAAYRAYFLPHEAEGTNQQKLKFSVIVFSLFVVVISIIMIPWGIETFFDEYHDTIFPAQIMSISIIPMSILALLETKFLGNENSKFVLFASIIQTSSYLILLTIFAETLGLVGIAFSFVILLVIKTIFLSIFYRIKFR